LQHRCFCHRKNIVKRKVDYVGRTKILTKYERLLNKLQSQKCGCCVQNELPSHYGVCLLQSKRRLKWYVLSAERMSSSKWMLASEPTPSHTMGMVFTKYISCYLQNSEMYCVAQLAQLKWILDIVFVQVYHLGCSPDGSVIESFTIFVGCHKFYKT
jgi:hypothetical protein